MSLSVLLMIGSILAVSKLDVALVLARLDGVGDTFMACLVVAWTGPVLIVVTCSSSSAIRVSVAGARLLRTRL